MRIKHTFFFTMLVGLVWVGLLFGYQNGPAATGAGAVNGVFGPAVTCNQSGCHSSFPVNSPGGTLTLSGLPAQWSAGVTYPLTVTIQKTGALIYGFQLSAVFDSSNPPRQAGSLSKGKTSGTDATRISIIPLNGLQFAEHNNINAGLAATTTFFVNWTAPSDTSGGPVRFNLAGNAGNRDQEPTGDFIYTRADVVAPGVAAPPPDFALNAASGTATVNPGGSTTVGISVTAANGFNSPVDLAVSGLPTGVTGTFDVASIPPGANSTLTITAAANAAPGTFPLTVSGTNASLTHSTSISLTVAPPPGSPSVNFSVGNFASSSSSTDGSGNLAVGYATIQATSGTTPAGVEIFGFRSNNVLVSETGVPASPLITAGRIYAETTGQVGAAGTVNTGLAIANPSGQTATLSMFFTSANGTNTAVRQTTINAGQQQAAFLIQAPFADASLGSPFQGTFSFTSTVPVSVIALRGYTNEQGDFLISTLPVIDTTSPAGSGTQVLPHFAAGGGWTTQVILINQGTTALAGNVQFLSGGGQAAAVTIGSQVTGTSAYSIAAGSSQKILVSGPAASTATGSIQVVPTAGGPAPVPLVVFTFKPGAITVTEAGAPSNSGTAFRMYVQSSGVSGQPGNIQSGIAVANTTTAAANVTFELFNPDGTGITSAVKTIPPSGQIVGFLGDIFMNLPASFQAGVLRISSASAISVVGLRGRYNERADFLITTTPPTLESAAASTAELLFPHFVNGGGYTTQFILFSGTAGQTGSGTLQFFDQQGRPLSLSLKN